MTIATEEIMALVTFPISEGMDWLSLAVSV